MSRRTLIVLLLAGASALQIPPTIADGPPMSGGDFEIVAYSVEGGGGAAGGGAYRIDASVGSNDADSLMEGGDFAVEGGFWPGGKGPGDTIFKTGFE